MAKAQFQGYARGKGYTSIDPGYIALTRDSEKQQRELADLKENQKEKPTLVLFYLFLVLLQVFTAPQKLVKSSQVPTLHTNTK